MKNRHQVGAQYEGQVAEYLSENGWEILERNFRCKMGEIDLIGREQDTICFIEVKFRQSRQHGDPAEAVDGRKRRRISNAAACYLYSRHYPSDTPCRFDVASVSPDGIRLIRNAFDYTGRFSM